MTIRCQFSSGPSTTAPGANFLTTETTPAGSMRCEKMLIGSAAIGIVIRLSLRASRTHLERHPVNLDLHLFLDRACLIDLEGDADAVADEVLQGFVDYQLVFAGRPWLV